MSDQNPSSLIGGDLKGMAGLSAFGRIYRLSRLNSLSPWQAIDVLGVPKTVLYHLRNHGLFIWPDGAAWDDLPMDQRPLACPAVEDFLLCQPCEDFDIDERIRGCAACLRSGFHSLLHQLPWIEACPWHQDPLIRNCRCGRLLNKGLGLASRPLLMCVCGHDHFDRLEALRSLATWPEHEVMRALQHSSSTNRPSAARSLLITDGELSTGEAMAAAHDLGLPGHLLLKTEVTGTRKNDDQALRDLIRRWDDLDHPSHVSSVPILPDDTELLCTFSKKLFERIQAATNGASNGPFLLSKGQLFYEHKETDKIAWLNTAHMSHRDIRLGHLLIKRLVDEQIPKVASDEPSWRIRRETALAKPSDPALHLLAHTLSAISAQALMEQWTFDAWRAYSEEEGGTLACYGHPIVLWYKRGRPMAKVVRVLSIPEFKDPRPEQSYNYRRPTHRRGGVRSPYHWPE
jgi:hypothetical protein